MVQAHSPDYVLEIARAHEQLGKLLLELEELTRRPQRREPIAALTRLRTLEGELRGHFALEERGGYMAPVLERAPHLCRTARDLLEEHRQLEVSLSGLIYESASPRADASFWASLGEWLAQVRRHEAKENQVVQEAYDRDAEGED
jgi:hypothetical protein